MQGPEHEVAGLGERQGELNGLRVAHLTDEDDVGVLAQRRAQGARERISVEPDLPLVHGRGLVPVHVLDRILDGEDVQGPPGVDVVDQRGQRRRLAGSGRAGDEHESLRELAHRAEHVRKAQLLGRRDRKGNGAKGQRERALGHEDVPPEAVRLLEREGEVDLLVLVQLLAHLLGKQSENRGAQAFVTQDRLAGDGIQTAVNAHAGRHSSRQQQVGCTGLHDRREEAPDRLSVDLFEPHRV